MNELLKNIVILFGKNRGKFVGANVFGNLIPLLIAPILTRLYSPVDFGDYAIYFVSVSILGSIGSLSLQNAVFVADTDESAVDLCVTAIIIGAIVCSLFSFLIVLNSSVLADVFFGDVLDKNLLLLVGSLYFVTLYACLYSLALRMGFYSILTKNKLILSVTLGFLQVGIGLQAGSARGLMLANFIGVILSVVLIIPSVLSMLAISLKKYSFNIFYAQLRRHSSFIFYTAPATLVNTLSSSGPEIIIKLLFGSTSVGHYSLANRMLSAPLNFISGAMQDIFRERAASEGRDSGNYKNTFNLFFTLTFAASVALVVPIAFFAPTLFKLIFGLEWEESGYITQSLAFLVVTRFVSSPLSYIWILKERQKEDFIWQIGLMIITFLSLSFTYYSDSAFSLNRVVLGYSLAAGMWYLVCLWISAKWAR